MCGVVYCGVLWCAVLCCVVLCCVAMCCNAVCVCVCVCVSSPHVGPKHGLWVVSAPSDTLARASRGRGTHHGSHRRGGCPVRYWTNLPGRSSGVHQGGEATASHGSCSRCAVAPCPGGVARSSACRSGLPSCRVPVTGPCGAASGRATLDPSPLACGRIVNVQFQQALRDSECGSSRAALRRVAVCGECPFPTAPSDSVSAPASCSTENGKCVPVAVDSGGVPHGNG